MDLVTVINQSFAKNAENLIKSYKHYSYNMNCYVYYFGQLSEEIDKLTALSNVYVMPVNNDVEYAHNPRAFYYKTYAIADSLKHTRPEGFIYSDSTNCFVSKADRLEEDLIDGSMLLPYPYEKLINAYWTTRACLEGIPDSIGAAIMPQYWAGFQVYRKTDSNIAMLNEMHECSKQANLLLPDTTVKRPDGENAKCIEHRQDQSILSILIHKYDKHQKYDPYRQQKYGDWQTFVDFDQSYTPDNSGIRILSSRESKAGIYRFL
jgi:hypothetical protein